MGLFDGILGGAVSGVLVTALNSLVEKHGGIQGVVKEFEQKGLGETVKSWVGTGENKPITPAQVHQAVGADTLKELAAKTGLSTEELAAKLAQILPAAIDKATPNGRVPA